MNIPPIVPNAIANRTSEPNKKERKPNTLINALPTPLVSFALVGISPSVNSTSLSPYKPPSASHDPANSWCIVQPTCYYRSPGD
jgi:hypothetical protein